MSQNKLNNSKYHQAMFKYGKALISQALVEHNNNVLRTAKDIGLSRGTIRKMIGNKKNFSNGTEL